jgi:1-phosphofructokinase family hexose kinase
LTATSRSAEFVAVSTNPAIDRVARIGGPAHGVVAASELLETPGGKAVHAACVAAELGATAAVITTAGGWNGERLLALLAAAEVEVVDVPIAAPTRGTYTVVEDGSGELVEVHEPAGRLREDEAERLVAALAGLRWAPVVVAVCGSLPPGAPTDLHARLVATARDRGAFTILDCSTPDAFAAALAAEPDLAAPNLAEAGALLGADLDPGCHAELESAVERIREMGARALWLSLGPEGSVFATGDKISRLTAPGPATVVNAVGCGDALIGGFAAGLIAGQEPLAAAVLGVAAATEKLSHLHPGRVDRAAVEALVPVIETAPLRAEATLP